MASDAAQILLERGLGLTANSTEHRNGTTGARVVVVEPLVFRALLLASLQAFPKPAAAMVRCSVAI